MEPDWLRIAHEKGLHITEGPKAVLPPVCDPGAIQGTKKTILEAMNEAEFQQQVITLAQSFGWKAAHFRKVRVARKNGQVYWETPVAADGKGWPDLFLARPGRKPVIAAELKVLPNKPSAEQHLWLDLLESCGIETHVWYPHDWDQIVLTLRDDK